MDESGEKENLNAIAPQFLVADVRKAAEYYRDRLGFWIGEYLDDPPAFVIVGRDGQRMMLSRIEGGRGGPNRMHKAVAIDAYIWARDVDSLHAEFAGRGAKSLTEPCDQSYGMREIEVVDLDGYVIRFGAPVAPR
jgi:uncharacterized glyoxalase superfamily protein PhnB